MGARLEKVDGGKGRGGECGVGVKSWGSFWFSETCFGITVRWYVLKGEPRWRSNFQICHIEVSLLSSFRPPFTPGGWLRCSFTGRRDAGGGGVD